MRITRQVFGCMFCIVSLSTLVTAQTSRQREAEPAYAYDQPNPDTYRRIANEVDTALLEDVAEVWFPRALDEQNGGYYSSFSREWRPTHPEGKFSAFQAAGR